MPNPRRQDESLEALYAQVPDVQCAGYCSAGGHPDGDRQIRAARKVWESLSPEERLEFTRLLTQNSQATIAGRAAALAPTKQKPPFKGAR
jgi:hypothetical protein